MSHPPRSSSYPVDLGFKDVRIGMYSEFVFDGDGIPMYPYADGTVYNITFVCHYALYRLSLFQRFGDMEARSDFLRIANWIAKRGSPENGVLKFYYHHQIPGLKAPWISALGQGRAMSVFTRAFEETGEGRFLDLAKAARRPMEIDVNDGGVCTTFPDGSIAFEEYPKAVPNLVLNGMITAIFGVADLARLGCEQSSELLKRVVTSLEQNVHRYDMSFGSRYDLSGPVPRIASWEYHQYHISQLWALHEMTGIDCFYEFASKWAQQGRGFRWLLARNASRLIHRLA